MNTTAKNAWRWARPRVCSMPRGRGLFLTLQVKRSSAAVARVWLAPGEGFGDAIRRDRRLVSSAWVQAIGELPRETRALGVRTQPNTPTPVSSTAI